MDKNRREVLARLNKAKAIKTNAVARAKAELTELVEKETGVRPTTFFVL